MRITRDTVIYAAAGAGVAFVLWKWGNPVTAAQIAAGWVQNVFARGDALSSSTLVGGVVQESPADLAAQAATVLGFDPDRDTLALARMGRSEGVDGEEFRMHVVLNMLAQDQQTYGTGVYSSVEALATHSKNATADGHFSKQGLGKPFSTSHDPYAGDYALAQKVIADNLNGIDPTNGAVKFVDKSGPFYIDGAQVSYDDLVASWAAEGLTPQPPLPGATDNFVVFTRSA